MVLILNFLNFISGIRTLPQRKMNKRKEGAEKERIRNKTSLKNHAHKYQKLTNMFATSSSTNSTVNISTADIATAEIITDPHSICDAADAVFTIIITTQ